VLSFKKIAKWTIIVSFIFVAFFFVGFTSNRVSLATDNIQNENPIFNSEYGYIPFAAYGVFPVPSKTEIEIAPYGTIPMPYPFIRGGYDSEGNIIIFAPKYATGTGRNGTEKIEGMKND
jgi:hypothetical protein